MKSRLRILFLLQDPPFPVIDGMRWKVYFLLKFLSRKHHCDVMCFVSDPRFRLEKFKDELPQVGFLTQLPTVTGWRRVVSAVAHVARGLPPSFARYRSARHEETFENAVASGRYDVIHYDIVNTAQFLRFAATVPSVHSPNDATSLFYSRMALCEKSTFLRMKLKLASLLLRRYERATYDRFTKIHVVSDADAKYLRRLVPTADVVKIHFGVDDADIGTGASGIRNGVPLILVLGGANVPGIASGILEFVEKGIPSLHRWFPGVRIRFHGRDMEKFLAGVSIPGQVEISSWVDDFNALLDQATAVVLPDKAGTGIKTRALQAMARGKPLVGTEVALEGIREVVVNGEHCLVASDIEGVTTILGQLIGDQERCRMIGRNAMELVAREFSWRRLISEYEDMYRSAVAKGGSS